MIFLKILNWLKEKTKAFEDWLFEVETFMLELDERTMLIFFLMGFVSGFCVGKI